MPPKRKNNEVNKQDDNKVINFYELPDIKENLTNHYNPAFEHTQMAIPARVAVVSLSGGGKSNFLMNYIKLCSSYGDGTFKHIHIVHKIDEDLYDYLEKACKGAITFYKNLAKLPQPKDLEPKDGHNLVVFDDVINDKDQQKICDYYIYGRKINNGMGCSCIYISQKYFSIPKVVRSQLNYIILLKIRGVIDLNNICRDVDMGIKSDLLKQIYDDATKEHLNFLKISTTERDDNRILSKNWKDYYRLKN
jgi:hypothetical protein